MAIRTESRITITRGVAEVWAYMCDVARWPEWAPTVLECWVSGGGALAAGSRVEQRAKLILGLSRRRAQNVTSLQGPNSMAFAGAMGPSPARWGMELKPTDDGQTQATMWIEVDLRSMMRAIPGALRARIQRVSDQEMVAIKAALESG